MFAFGLDDHAAFCTPLKSSRRMIRFAPRCKVGVGVAAGVTARVAAGVAGVAAGVAVRFSVRVFFGASLVGCAVFACISVVA